jgi:uncharacterized membrane protein YoaK (UPF0700 family)
MLVRQGGDRNDDIDRRLATILALVAGALNAAGFHAVGLFSANMTGNVSSLSDHFALGQFGLAALFLAIVFVFIGGATTSTLMISAGRRRHWHSIYALSLMAEAVLLIGLGLADLYLPGVHRGAASIFGLSFLMGLQNAIVTNISGARVRTTHVSGMVTDIGIELATLFDIAQRREPRDEAPHHRSKLRLHAQTVLAFLIGGILGVLLYQAIGGLLLIGTALPLVVISFPVVLQSSKASSAAE